tara:strand:- start:480 stop:779 length:300 start_codon:yes stop_codon:yes gene_type:complete
MAIMAKIGESYKFEDDTLIIKNTHDANDMLKDVEHARQHSDNSFGSDYKHVGNVDMALLGVWLKEAGVQWTDTQAVKDVLKRKLMSNEFSKLRVWEGTY